MHNENYTFAKFEIDTLFKTFQCFPDRSQKNARLALKQYKVICLISAYSSFCQESLVYANRSLEAVPGEKVLRDSKEQRDQQNRLKEIDHQLKSLERNLVSLLFLSYFFPLSLRTLESIIPCVLKENQTLQSCVNY